jgi:aspartate carbamoyltransferase catalytic subunit
VTSLRHITSINDLTAEEVGRIFSLADKYLKKLGDEKTPYRIARSIDVLSGSILAGLFYEPSTRTRLSFESAMLRLGGQSMASADPRTSSASKGESLADTVRVVGSYADILVIRHPRDGAAKLAASYASVPVINGGDGSHEHPTQTLCDLFTLKRKKGALRNLNVAISGDLKASRTIHSFVYALGRFGANILLKPAPGMELPADVAWRLENEFHRKRVEDNRAGDVWYVASGEPRRKQNIDAVYVTRFQSERWSNAAGDYPKVNADFLRSDEYRQSAVMHPLPRVSELDLSLDDDKRAAYFEQAAYGVPIRMALLASLLSSERHPLKRFDGGFPVDRASICEAKSSSEIACANGNCIVHDPVEKPYTANRFHVVASKPPRLRCFYCETDIEMFWVGEAASKAVSPSNNAPFDWSRKRLAELRFFATLEKAMLSGFSPLKNSGRATGKRHLRSTATS